MPSPRRSHQCPAPRRRLRTHRCLHEQLLGLPQPAAQVTGHLWVQRRGVSTGLEHSRQPPPTPRAGPGGSMWPREGVPALPCKASAQHGQCTMLSQVRTALGKQTQPLATGRPEGNPPFGLIMFLGSAEGTGLREMLGRGGTNIMPGSPAQSSVWPGGVGPASTSPPRTLFTAVWSGAAAEIRVPRLS